MKKKNLILIIAGLAAVLVVLVCALFALRGNSSPSYESLILSGQKYYDAGDYDQALLKFQAAMELDEAGADAYIGASMVYRARGLDTLAKQTLETGLIRSGGSSMIQSQLMVYYPEHEESASSEAESSYDESKQGTGAVSLDVELLQFLAGSTYEDYRNKYPDLRSEYTNGRCVLSSDGLGADVIYFDTDSVKVINVATQLPYTENIPNEIVFWNILRIFGGGGYLQYDTLRTMSGISNLTRQDGRLRFEAYGCELSVACDDEGGIHSGAENLVTPSGTVAIAGEHKVYGTVTDAANGGALSGVELSFYEGAVALGDPETATSGFDGSYAVSLRESGVYTVRLSKPGYITETAQVYISGGSIETRSSFAMSRELAAGEIRIVLTWGASPTDLDSHLNGNLDDGTRVSVNYRNKVSRDGSGAVVAELDVDDTSSYGPETTTIYDLTGSFYFDVGECTGSGGGGVAGATVKIYKGSSLVQTITPSGGIGLGWRVCQIDHGEIIVLNTSIATRDGMPAV